MSESERRSDAAYEFGDPQNVRQVVKLLEGNGYAADELFVLCSEPTRQSSADLKMLPARGPVLSTAPAVVATAGATIGAAILGGAASTGGVTAAVAAACVGAIGGAIGGLLLGVATSADTLTRRLYAANHTAIDQGRIVLVVRPKRGDIVGRLAQADALIKDFHGDGAPASSESASVADSQPMKAPG